MINIFMTPLSTGTTTTAGFDSLLTTLLPFGLVIVVLYFLMIRPQRKKEKKAADMRNNLQIGDEITTVGGIVGIVFSIKEDTIVIETGGDRSKIRIKRWAIQSNDTIHDTVEK